MPRIIVAITCWLCCSPIDGHPLPRSTDSESESEMIVGFWEAETKVILEFTASGVIRRMDSAGTEPPPLIFYIVANGKLCLKLGPTTADNFDEVCIKELTKRTMILDCGTTSHKYKRVR